MNDILLLIILPLVASSVIAIILIIKNHLVAQSNKLEDRVTRNAKRPREIRDSNHKLTNTNNLMQPETDQKFTHTMVEFFRNSIRD